jgi:hypothetical protein
MTSLSVKWWPLLKVNYSNFVFIICICVRFCFENLFTKITKRILFGALYHYNSGCVLYFQTDCYEHLLCVMLVFVLANRSAFPCILRNSKAINNKSLTAVCQINSQVAKIIMNVFRE